MAKPKYLQKKKAAAAAAAAAAAEEEAGEDNSQVNSPTTGNDAGNGGKPAEELRTSGAMVAFANPVYRQGVNDILVEKIDISYQGNQILENATLNLVSGHRYGLVGPNGCGKSTLLRVLGCHEIPFPSHVDRY